MQCPEEFFDAYVECALWSSTDNDGDPLNESGRQIDQDTLDKMRADCDAFYDANCLDLVHDDIPPVRNGVTSTERAGHDFWLTRCGHGAGFWDGDWPEPYATRLTDACKAFGNVDLYVGDDGKIYA